MRMKLTIMAKFKILCLAVCFLILAPATLKVSAAPQDNPVTLNRENTTIRAILEEIERTTPYKFFYNDDIVDADKRVTSFNVSNRPLRQVLDMLFEGTDITYNVVDQQVVLSVRPPRQVESSKITVTGRISEADGTPVLGVSVIERGTTNGVVSVTDGYYSITVGRDATIDYTFLGYKTVSQPVSNRTHINVVMEEDVMSIATVVAIGYGSQRKEDLSMAVSTLRIDDAMRSRSNGSDISGILQGRIPGLTVMQSGDPAKASTFSIRGRGSKGDDNDPNKTDGVLIVVDGVPGAPYSIDDVEDISVLKDAASASIYGAQVGAGGVILITTKRAQAGKTRLDVNVSTGFQKVTNLPSVLTAEQYNQVWQDQSAKYGTGLPDRSNTTIYPYGNVTRTNWLDEIYRTGRTNHVSATLSGGNETTLNLFSIAYDDQQGVLRNTYSKAVAAKMSTDFTPFKWLKFSERVNVKLSRAQGNIDTGHEGPIIAALWYPRSATVYEMNDDGTYALDDNGNRIYGGTSPRNNAMSDYPNIYNPVAVLDKLHRKYPQNEFYSTTGLEIRPVSGLVLRSDFSGSYTYKESDEFYPVMNAPGLMRTENSREQFYDKFKKWLSETTATYSAVFGKHHVSAMVGFSANWEYQNYKTIYTGDYQYENEQGMLWGSANQWTNRKMEEAAYKFSMVSVISRIGYSYDDRYFLVGSIRRDASSKLPATKNYDVFPAVSGSWKLTSEQFFKNLDLKDYISLIKVRAGWGKIGNVDSYDLANITDIALSNVSYPIILGQNLNNQIYGTYIGTIANPYAKWETTKQLSAGIDIGLFDNALEISVDFYDKNTKDLVDVLDLVPHMGVDNPPYGNLGHVVNRGWEFSATYNARKGDWTYNAWGMYNYNKGYVKKYGSIPIYYHDGAGQLITSNRILASGAGYPWRSFYVYRTAGIFQSYDEISQYVWKDPQTGQTKILQPNAQPGDVRWVDTNNDGVISESDRVFVGSYDPKHTFSFGGSVSWKGIDFSLMFQGVAGNYIYNATKQLGMRGRDGANMVTDVLNAWDYNSSSIYPKLGVVSDTNNNYQYFSDIFLERGDYLRLKNLTVGYTIPSSALKKIGLQQCKIRAYFSAENLCTWTKYTGTDPEVGNYGIDRGVYPLTRFFNFGINLNF